MHSPTGGSRYGVVTGPDRTQNEETPPGDVRSRAAAHGACRVAIDATSGEHVDSLIANPSVLCCFLPSSLTEASSLHRS